jgi:hypothetical protein
MSTDVVIPPDLPITLPVAIPAGRPKNWGVNATSHHDAHRQMVRWNKDEWTQVEKWAKLLNITPTQFVRDASDNMVAALEKQAKQWSNSDVNLKHSGGG